MPINAFIPDLALRFQGFLQFRKRFLIGLCLIGLAPLSPALAQTCSAPREAIPGLVAASKDAFFNAARTQEFYDQWGDSCAWSNQTAALLLNRISHVAEEGLDPRFFDALTVISLTPPKNTEAARRRDLILTDLALRYARVMVLGQVDPNKFDQDIYYPRRKLDLTTSLVTAFIQDNFSGWLQNLVPADPAYKPLKEMLAYYRHIRKNGGWEMLPPGNALKPGKSDPILPALRRRLRVEGDLAAAETRNDDDPVFDEATVAALKHFQARHGLNPDGVLGNNTRRMLNIPVEIWIDRIIANLDRRRYLGPVLPQTRFEVNIPAAEAVMIKDGAPLFAMRAVVGKSATPSPLLLSVINEVIINPTWTVPVSIIKNEIPPSIRHDPTYLAKNRMHWTQGMLVQAAGPENSLGRLKFNFSNPFSVYLHDTPAKSLFSQDDRARSHGCMRLEHPLDLAAYLLTDDPDWPQTHIEEAIASRKTIRILLREEVPVAIVYWTAYVGLDGAFELRDDVYNRDARHFLALVFGHSLTALP